MLARINRIFNPFSIVPHREIVKTEQGIYRNQATYLPHSRTLHTSFSEKFNDTYFVFRGYTEPSLGPLIFFIFNWEERLGIFDYLILGIGRLLNGLMALSFVSTHYITSFAQKLYEESKWYALIPLILVLLVSWLTLQPIFLLIYIPHLAINTLLRPAAAFGLTLLCLPAIGLAHGISQAIRKYKAGQVASMPITQEIHLDDTSTTTITLRSLLGEKISMRHDEITFPLERGKNTYQVRACQRVKGEAVELVTPQFSFSKDKARELSDKLAEVNPFVYAKQSQFKG